MRKKKFKRWRELCFFFCWKTELMLKMLEGNRFFRINSCLLLHRVFFFFTEADLQTTGPS